MISKNTEQQHSRKAAFGRGISAHRQDDEKEASHCAYWNASQSFDMQEISRRIFWLGFWAATFWDPQKAIFLFSRFWNPVKRRFL